MFNPNELQDGQWATYIPAASPSFIVHESQGRATARLKAHSEYFGDGFNDRKINTDCTLWKVQDGKWVQVYFDPVYKGRQKLKFLDKPVEAPKQDCSTAKLSQIVFSFDTTGSMHSCIKDVRKRIQTQVKQYMKDIPNLEIGIVAHGDYCDGRDCINILNFTKDVDEITTFVRTTPETYGGDTPECYEYVLNQVGYMNWKGEGTFIMIGDANPHDQRSSQKELDWKKELRSLLAKNITVMGVQCLRKGYYKAANDFWESLSEISKTPLIQLNDFSDSSNTLEAITYASAGEEQFENYKRRVDEEIKSGKRLLRSADYSTTEEVLTKYSKRVIK